jgi:hypothetical protein
VDAFLREFGKLMSSHFEGMAAKQEAEQQASGGAKPGQAGAGTGTGTGGKLKAGDSLGFNAVKTTVKKGAADAVTVAPAQLTAAAPSGPLYEQAMARQAAASKAVPVLSPAEQAAEDQRVKSIIQDPELSAMLMDPKMQAVLQDCGDPRKFQQIMRDPIMAKKIKKLFDSGLVSMAK